MEVCNLPRGLGKTTYLIYRSYITQYPIVCFSETHRAEVLKQSRRMRIDIPDPINAKDLLDKKVKPEKVLVDEALYVLKVLLDVDIDTASLSERDNADSLIESFLKMKY